VSWQPGDVSPDARRAAEAAAEAAGVSLKDWFAETVRAAIIRELGGLPAEQPESESTAPASASVDPPPAPPPSEPPTTLELPVPEPIVAVESLAPPMAARRDYGTQRISLGVERLADSGLSAWLATRIQGLPVAAGPAAPAATAQTSAFASRSTPSPPGAPSGSAIRGAPQEAALPLSLPAGPVTTVALANLRPARIRARHASDNDAAIFALAESVASQGVREPILVRRLDATAHQYEVVAGERRRLAAERAGRTDLPAVIVEADDAETLVLSLAENLGRGDFSPLDEARAYLRLLTEFRASAGVLAQRVARERSHIALALRLLGLPSRVRELIDSGRLAPAQAYVLLSAPDPEARAEQLIGAADGAPRGSN